MISPWPRRISCVAALFTVTATAGAQNKRPMTFTDIMELKNVGALHYRPRDLETLKKFQAELPPLKLFTVDETFGGWDKAQAHFFGDGGVFDQIVKK